MPRPREPSPQPASLYAADWAEYFFTRGWRHCYPWVVLERVPCDAARFEQALREAEDGWAFGLCSYRILHAPTFDIYADRATQLRIVQAIREYPARRMVQFQKFERPLLEAAGYPLSVLEHMAPRGNERLTEEAFQWPIFLVERDPHSSKYLFLGHLASLDIMLPALVRADVRIDEALALLILCTCHGKPAEYTYKTLADGTKVPHFTYPKSAFTRPFHPKRFKEIRLRLRERCVDDSVAAQKALLLQLLAKHLPGVVEGLRLKPEPPGKSVHSVARSRLVEAVSDELLGRARRARRGPGRDKWWELLDELPQRQLSAFFRSLTPAEHEELQAIRDGKRTSRNPNTARVLLHRACVKLRNLLREQHAVDAPSDA